MTVWHCIDFPDPECANQQHAWIQACLVEREDGSDAWLLDTEPDTEETTT
jgi:hypothetical protein